MKTNVDLEFISKVDALSKSMRDLANFWQDNSEMLEGAKVYKDYPFSINFEELAFDTYNWLLTLINDYCKEDPNTIFEFFNAYYKTLQK